MHRLEHLWIRLFVTIVLLDVSLLFELTIILTARRNGNSTGLGKINLYRSSLYSNGQDITLYGSGIYADTLDSSSFNGDGGKIKLESFSSINITGTINSSGSRNGGDIIIQQRGAYNLTIAGDINASGSRNGGNINIQNDSSYDVIVGGNINASGGQNGGDINIRARRDITTQNIRSDSPRNAGNINIKSTGYFYNSDGAYVGKIDTTAGIVSAAGGTRGGNINLSAISDINTGTITLFNPGFNGDSGKIEITSTAGNIDTTRGSLITSSALGRSGDVTLTSEQKDVPPWAIGNATQLTFGGNVNVADINAQSIANQGGAISITADRTITTQGDITTNDNSLTFDGTVNLADNNTFKVEGDGNITFGSTLDGSHELTLDAQTVTLEDSVGATTPLDRLTVRNGTVLNDTTATNVTARQDISVSHIDSKQAISLNSLEGEVTTGNLTSTESITLAGNTVTTGNIDAEQTIDLTSRIDNLTTANIATRETLNISTPKTLTTGNINAQNETSLEAQSIETGNITIQDDLALTSINGDIFTQQIDTQGELSISTTNGDLATENITATDRVTLTAREGSIQTENITTPANVTLTSHGAGITTGTIDTSATTDAGHVTLQADNSIHTASINAQSSNETGGNVTINTPRFFQASDTFSDRNGQNASISVAGAIEGGEVKIYHGGNGEIPFIVGDASTNGTTGEITRGNDMGDRSIETYQEYPYTHKQDSDRLQIVSVPQPQIPAQPQPTSPPLPATSPDPLTPPPENPEPLEELDRGDNPIESLALLIGNLLNAETNITTDETVDYAFEWQTSNPNTGEQVLLSLDVENPYNEETNNPETPNPIAIADITLPSLNALTSLNLNANPEQLVSDIDQLLEEEYESYFGENLTNEKVTAQSIRDTLKTIEIETGTRAVIIYALPLPEALQLVLVRPDSPPRVYRVSEAKYRDLRREIGLLRDRLLQPDNHAYRTNARKLYNWLVAPLEDELERLEIDTLVFSLGSILRSLPLSALHNGEGFLIEKYSLGSIPSVSLTDTRYQSLERSRVLGMGASEFPNTSYDPLPAVPIELAAATETFRQGTSFLNQEFTLENLQAQRRQNRFDIVHLATHASFQPSYPENAHIQFWDKKIGLEGLRQAQWYADPAVELLILSACTTAIGDRRSEMGFAGLAVQAGVKSALASLWDVNDLSTLVLMGEFYQAVNAPDVKIKAEALRQAQLRMLSGQVRVEAGQLLGWTTPVNLPSELTGLDRLDFSHPYFWTGFSLVGSPW